MITGQIIRWSTAGAVAGVAAVASYEHAYALVRAHGETGWMGRLVPLTVDGLIYASSMVLPDAARRQAPVPALARWLPGLGIAATPAANVAHGLGHGPAGAAVAAWPAVALAGSYESFMTVIRGARQPDGRVSGAEPVPGAVSGADPLRVGAAGVFAAGVAAGFPRSGLSGRGCGWGSRGRSRYARIWPHSVTGRSAESAPWRSCRVAWWRTARLLCMTTVHGEART
jgi:hypothetical protein